MNLRLAFSPVLICLLLGPILPQSVTAETATNYIKRAYTRHANGEEAGALADFDQAIAMDPQNADAFVGRAVVEQSLHDPKGSMDDDSHALKLRPKDVQAYVHRGSLKEANHDLDGALADFDRALELDPNCYPGLMERANLRGERGYFDGALSDLDHAVRLLPARPDAYNDRATIYGKQGDFARAISDEDVAIRLGPKDAFLYFNRGLCKKALGDLPGAAADFDKAIGLMPGLVTFQRARTELEQKRSEARRAEEDPGKSQLDQPTTASTFLSQGSRQRFQGEYAAAVKSYSRAMAFDSEDAMAYKLRGEVQTLNGSGRAAVEDYRRYMELSPRGDAYPLLFIWVLRTRSGETESANQELSAAPEKIDKTEANAGLLRLGGFLLGSVSQADLLQRQPARVRTRRLLGVAKHVTSRG